MCQINQPPKIVHERFREAEKQLPVLLFHRFLRAAHGNWECIEYPTPFQCIPNPRSAFYTVQSVPAEIQVLHSNPPTPVIHVRRTSNCLRQFLLAAKTASRRNAKSHTDNCLKYGTFYRDLKKLDFPCHTAKIALSNKVGGKNL